MKKNILVFIIVSIVFGSCSSNQERTTELEENISTLSPVPSSTSTALPPSPTKSPTSVPTPEPFIYQTSTEKVVNFSLGGKEIRIELILQEDLDFDYLEISALDIEDTILIEIVDPQQVYLPYIGLITKTQENSVTVEGALPPKDLFAVSYGPYQIHPGDLDVELVAETSLDELSDQISSLEETGSISLLFPHYGEGVIYPELEVYKINHLNSVYLVLPSETQIWEVPVSLIPITFLINNGDQVLDAINDIIQSYGFNIGSMEVLPGVTYEQWITEGQAAYAAALNTPSLPPPVELNKQPRISMLTSAVLNQ